jgi:hypothetical protein
MVVIVLKYHSNRIALKTSPATCSLPPCAMVCDQCAPQPHRAQEVGEVQLAGRLDEVVRRLLRHLLEKPVPGLFLLQQLCQRHLVGRAAGRPQTGVLDLGVCTY